MSINLRILFNKIRKIVTINRNGKNIPKLPAKILPDESLISKVNAAKILSHYFERNRLFGEYVSSLFDNSWAIVLEIFVNTGSGSSIAIRELSCRRYFEQSTFQRYIAALESSGLVEKPLFSGNTVRLTPNTYRLMTRLCADL